MITGIMVAHHTIDGVEVIIPAPLHLLPSYDVGTLIIFSHKNTDVEGEVLAINTQCTLDPITREIESVYIYGVKIDGVDDLIEVLEDEITGSWDETNGLDSSYYEEEKEKEGE